MNREERIKAVLNGEKPDRIPVSVWFHFSGEDQDPISLAKITVETVEKYDYDFIKMMPFGNYGIQDLGAQLKIYSQKGKPPILLEPGIKTEADYNNLKVISALQGTYGKQVEFARELAKRVPANTPYIQTIFSPLTTLHKLTGGKVLEDLKAYPEAVHHALAVITAITRDFIQLNIEAGVSGFFFATQDARKELISLDDFKTFGEFYDLQVLNSYVNKTWFNVVHIHGLDVYFEELAQYPGNVINWHDRNTPPSLAEARKITSKVFLAGVRAEHHEENGVDVRSDIVADGTPEEIIRHVHEAIKEVDGKGLIIGPGCVVDPFSPEENLRAVRQAVEI